MHREESPATQPHKHSASVGHNEMLSVLQQMAWVAGQRGARGNVTQTAVLRARSALSQVQVIGEIFQFLHCFSFPLHHSGAGGKNEFQKDIVLTKYKPLLLW